MEHWLHGDSRLLGCWWESVRLFAVHGSVWCAALGLGRYLVATRSSNMAKGLYAKTIWTLPHLLVSYLPVQGSGASPKHCIPWSHGPVVHWVATTTTPPSKVTRGCHGGSAHTVQ